jgi:hypothetical protein
MKVNGKRIRIKLKSIGGGLTLGTPPPTAAGKTFPAPTELNGFGIAGAGSEILFGQSNP